MRVLTGHQVDEILRLFSYAEYIDLSTSALTAFSNNNCVCPSRIVIDGDDFTSLHMPSQMIGVVAEKVVCVPKKESSAGLPAFITILDRHTGRLQCIMDAARLTAVRTASASLISTMLITRVQPEWRPAHLWIFGSGEQAYQHTRLHLLACPTINRVNIVVRRETQRLRDLIARLREEFETVQLNTYSAAEVKDAKSGLREADIICCCTPSDTPLFSYGDFRSSSKRQHVILIGSYKPTMTEVDEETFKNASDIFVDSKNDCLKEAGDLMAAIKNGKIKEEDLSELGAVLGGATRPEMHKDDHPLSIYKSVGISVMDNSIAQAVYRKAEEMSFGTVIPEF